MRLLVVRSDQGTADWCIKCCSCSIDLEGVRHVVVSMAASIPAASIPPFVHLTNAFQGLVFSSLPATCGPVTCYVIAHLSG